ncbi:MAG: hypothetical protein V3T96_01840 [Thermodesulfobacteriota bacterium]
MLPPVWSYYRGVPRISVIRVQEEPFPSGFREYVSSGGGGDYLVISPINYEYIVKNRDADPEEVRFFTALTDGRLGYMTIKKFEKRPNVLGYILDDPAPPRDITETHPTIIILKKDL